MNVTDNNNDSNQCSIYVEHPTKSFTITADNIELKLKWLQALKQNIENCKNKQQIKQNDNSNNDVDDGMMDDSRNSSSSTINNDQKGIENNLRSSLTKSPLRRKASWRLS